MNFKLTINSRAAGKKYDATELIDGDVTWTTSRNGSAGKLTFTVVKHGEIVFHEGDQVRFMADGVSYFLGYIFTKEKSHDKIAVTCYDMLRYLKAKQSYAFSKMKLSDVVRLMAAEFNLTAGDIEDTGYVMPDKIYEEKTLLDIINDCITITAVATGKIYVLFDGVNQLCLKEIGNMVSAYTLSGKDFIQRDYTYTTSIDESYNYVKLIRPNEESGKGDAYIARDEEKMQAWGKLQYYALVDEGLNAAQIQEQAQNLLKYYAQTNRKLRLPCLGVPDIQAGSMVMIDMPALGDISLNKHLLIDTCVHKWTADTWTMTLEMAVTNG